MMLAYHGDEAIKTKYCLICNAELVIRVSPSGLRESPSALARRKFCSLRCSGAQNALRANARGLSWDAAHRRARQIKDPGNCEVCLSSLNIEIHHRNENWRDNTLENLQRLCSSCHKKAHSHKLPCELCGKPSHARRLCNRHYLRWKTLGDPRLVRIGGNQYVAAKMGIRE